MTSYKPDPGGPTGPEPQRAPGGDKETKDAWFLMKRCWNLMSCWPRNRSSKDFNTFMQESYGSSLIHGRYIRDEDSVRPYVSVWKELPPSFFSFFSRLSSSHRLETMMPLRARTSRLKWGQLPQAFGKRNHECLRGQLSSWARVLSGPNIFFLFIFTLARRHRPLKGLTSSSSSQLLGVSFLWPSRAEDDLRRAVSLS